MPTATTKSDGAGTRRRPRHHRSIGPSLRIDLTSPQHACAREGRSTPQRLGAQRFAHHRVAPRSTPGAKGSAAAPIRSELLLRDRPRDGAMTIHVTLFFSPAPRDVPLHFHRAMPGAAVDVSPAPGMTIHVVRCGAVTFATVAARAQTAPWWPSCARNRATRSRL